MDVLIILLALGLLMFVAYRGLSVIFLAPLCALLAVGLSLGAESVLPYYTNVFMGRLVDFVKLYFPVFMLGAVFGKLIELSGAAASISRAIVRMVGAERSILAIVLACAVLTYGGVSLFVVAFAVYPLAAALFRQADIPKRLIPGTIALGSFTFTMDSLPGTPQIQNVIPTTFFGTNLYAAPVLGTLGAAFVLAAGLLYLERRKRAAQAAGEGYGQGHLQEPDPQVEDRPLPSPWLALLPLLVVALTNRWMTGWLPSVYGAEVLIPDAGTVDIAKVKGVWALQIALVAGLAATTLVGWSSIVQKFREGLTAAVSGSMLATLNTASEYGFGAVIAALPGFLAVKGAIGGAFSNPLVNEAVSVNVLAGITGSASGGMSIALAAMGQQYLAAAQAAGISPEVLHRVASMASGGMDTLPHNGAVITLLAITGLTHRQSYGDIFAITVAKTLAVFFVIAVYGVTGWV